MMRSIDRRRFLRGLGGITLALPLLDVLSAKAAAPSAPKRLVVFFSNNGTHRPAWTPTASAPASSTILAPLKPFEPRLLVFDGLDMECSYHGPGTGDPHNWIASILTGTELIQPSGYKNPIGGGQSVDQFLAGKLGASTKFPSLELSVLAQGGKGVLGSLSYAGPAQPLPLERNPWSLFDRLFSDLNTDPNAMAALHAQRKSVIDAVADELETLSPKLGGTDREKLDRHLTSVRALEKQLDAIAAPTPACVPPSLSLPKSVAVDDPTNMEALGRAQIELLATALRCDMTRIATLQFSNALGYPGEVFSWLGHKEHVHTISHKPDSDAIGNQEKTEINLWYAQQFAYLLSQLDVAEDGGSLLDHCAVLWVNELSKGNNHSRRDMPFVLAGGCHGFFATGKYVKLPKQPHNRLLITLCHALDVPVSEFGNPAYCAGGPLPQLMS